MAHLHEQQHVALLQEQQQSPKKVKCETKGIKEVQKNQKLCMVLLL